MLKAGITGINAVDNPAPGIGVVKGLRTAFSDLQVVGLSYDVTEPGIFLASLIDRVFILPYPSRGKEPFFERLMYVREKTGLNLVIPNLDSELPLFISLEDELRDEGVSLFIPTKAQFELRAKDRLIRLAKRIGISVPETKMVSTEAELTKALDDVGFPVMVKGVFYEAKIAASYVEALKFFREISSRWGFPVIVQEVVEGDELNVVGVGDGEGGHFGLVAMKKLTTTSLGKVWMGVTIRNEALFESVEHFVSETKWRGAFEYEVKAAGSKLYLIEINPRFPAWLYLAVGVGVNLPERVAKAALGEVPSRDWNYEAGKLYVRYTEDFVTDMEVFKRIITRGER
ncbi:MAG: carboxylate--amine ligase [Deferribacteres bacterium]|nr:carboxylate--amine ligase [Deferribacteres bacterium]